MHYTFLNTTQKSRRMKTDLQTLCILLLSVSLISCSDDSSDSSATVWTEQSESLTLIISNGFEPGESESGKWTASRDTLTSEALSKLKALEVLDLTPSCYQDGATGRLSITDGDGLTRTFISEGANCNDINFEGAVEYTELTELSDSL